MLQSPEILPKAEIIITGHHEHDWDRNTGFGRVPHSDRPELSADTTDTTRTKGWSMDGRHGLLAKTGIKNKTPNPGI